MYHPAVRVAFQKDGWLTKDMALYWAEQVRGPWVQQQHLEWQRSDQRTDSLLLMESKPAQKCWEFLAMLSASRTVAAFGPPRCSQAWQPVERGHVGGILKQLAEQEMQAWLDEAEENWQKFSQNRVTTREKRVLLSHWYGRAWTRFNGPDFVTARTHAFECCGAAADVHGLNDHLIDVLGLGKEPLGRYRSTVRQTVLTVVRPPGLRTRRTADRTDDSPTRLQYSTVRRNW